MFGDLESVSFYRVTPEEIKNLTEQEMEQRKTLVISDASLPRLFGKMRFSEGRPIRQGTGPIATLDFKGGRKSPISLNPMGGEFTIFGEAGVYYLEDRDDIKEFDHVIMQRLTEYYRSQDKDR